MHIIRHCSNNPNSNDHSLLLHSSIYLCETVYTSLARTLVCQLILQGTSLLKEILLVIEATVVVSGVSGFV